MSNQKSAVGVVPHGMLGRLALRNIANCDIFTGDGVPTAWGRLYGGQAVTQASRWIDGQMDEQKEELQEKATLAADRTAGNRSLARGA